MLILGLSLSNVCLEVLYHFLGCFCELRGRLGHQSLVVGIDKAHTSLVCVSLGHQVLNLSDKLIFLQLVDQVALDIAREDRLLVLLDHGQIGGFHLLDCSDFEVVHLRVINSESGI